MRPPLDYVCVYLKHTKSHLFNYLHACTCTTESLHSGDFIAVPSFIIYTEIVTHLSPHSVHKSMLVLYMSII